MHARAYVRIWTPRSWYNNSTSQWRVKIETRPFYRNKFNFWKTWRSNLVCHGTFLGGFTKGQINITEEKLLSLVVIAWTVLKLFNFLARVPQKLFPPTPAKELTNRRLSHEAAAGSRHSSALPSCRNLNLRFVVKTTTLVREAGKFSRRFWSLFSSFHK